MNIEIHRFNTFEQNGWSLDHIPVLDLTAAGFFHLQDDYVQCAFCRVILHNWKVGDTPLRRHVLKNPKCPFLLGKNVKNVPLYQSIPAESRLNVAVNRTIFNMNFEINRLHTLKKNWRKSYISVADLTEAGFFYLYDDSVQCAFCYTIVNNWKVGDRPLRRHMINSPRCPFLIGRNVGNVPLYKSEPANKKKQPDLSHLPKHPSWKDLGRRVRSFNDTWSSSERPSRKQLADCGFYYTGVGDCATCHHCGVTLGNWKWSDCVWEEHEKHSPNCYFLKHHYPKDWKFDYKAKKVLRDACEIFPESLVRKVAEQFQGKKPITSLHVFVEEVLEFKELQRHKKATAALKEIKEEEKEEEEKEEEGKEEEGKELTIPCKICMTAERETAFQPCGHIISCAACSDQIQTCPVCRRDIFNKVKIYIS